MGKHQIVVKECTQMYSACDDTNTQVLLVTGGTPTPGTHWGTLSSTEVSLTNSHLAKTCIGEIGKQ